MMHSHLKISIITLFITSCMISTKGVKFKTIVRNFSDSTYTMKVVDKKPITVVKTLYHQSVSEHLTFYRLDNLKDTVEYSKPNDSTVVFKIPGKTLIEINGLIARSNDEPSSRTMNILDGKGSLVDSVSLGDVLNDKDLFKPIGHIFKSSIITHDILK